MTDTELHNYAVSLIRREAELRAEWVNVFAEIARVTAEQGGRSATMFERAIQAATTVRVNKADVSFTYCAESEEVQGIVRAVFNELGLPT